MDVSDHQLPNTTYKGYCSDSHYTRSSIANVNVRDVHNCHEECKNSVVCVAFAFSSKPLPTYYSNCHLYGRRPRRPNVIGTDATNVICYVFPGNNPVLKMTKNHKRLLKAR